MLYIVTTLIYKVLSKVVDEFTAHVVTKLFTKIKHRITD